MVVSADVRPFMPRVEEWVDQGAHYAGCILLPLSIRHQDLAFVISGIRSALSAIPEQQDWIDRIYRISKDASGS